jgi:hypothetical protein
MTKRFDEIIGHFNDAVRDFLSVVNMLDTDARYCVLSDHSVRRNPTKKPLLHNGGKPR